MHAENNAVKEYREKLGLSKEKLVLLVNLEAIIMRDPIDFDLIILNEIETNKIQMNYDVALILSRVLSVDIKKLFDSRDIFAHYKKVIESTLDDFYTEKDLISLKAMHDFLMLDYLVDF